MNISKRSITLAILLSIFPQASSEISLNDNIKQIIKQRIKLQEKILGIEHSREPKFKFVVRNGRDIRGSNLAEYHFDDHTIYLPIGSVPENSTIDHELGHAYQDELNRNGELNYCFAEFNDKYQTISMDLVVEGIAEYFSKKLSGESTLFGDEDWPDDLDEWKDCDIDEIGYHLVGPVIDKYGKRSIEYLMKHPPRVKDLSDIKSYQSRIMSELNR